MTKKSMTEPAPDVPDAEKEAQKAKAKVIDMLRHSILEKLGKPKNFERITASAVGDNRYRVNVYCHSPVIISDSFYVIAKPDGIVESRPPIQHKY